jgi:hypothetical protein
MRGPPGALDGTGSSKVAGGGVTEKEAALQRNILMVRIKNEAMSFIVYNNPIHNSSTFVLEGDEAWLQQFML